MANRPAACAGILLAAGSSTRLGYPKQLLQLDGETLLHRSARIALEAGVDPLCVVLGSRAETLRDALQDLPRASIVVNSEWMSGMASSLRAGLALLGYQQDHALVMVCDQISLDSDWLRTLLDASREHPERIVAGEYAGKHGVPAIFPARYYPDLLAVEGDKGARDVLRRYPADVMALPFPAGVEDVDTTVDAARMGLIQP